MRLDELAARITRGAAQPAAAYAARRLAGPLDAQPLAGLHRDGSPGELVLSLRYRPALHRCAALRKVGFNIEEDGVVAKITAQSTTHPH